MDGRHNRIPFEQRAVRPPHTNELTSLSDATALGVARAHAPPPGCPPNGGHAAASSSCDELLDSQTDVFGDLPKKSGRDIPTLVNWYRGHTTVRMSELLVRAALAHLAKPEPLTQGNNLPGLEDRRLRQL